MVQRKPPSYQSFNYFVILQNMNLKLIYQDRIFKLTGLLRLLKIYFMLLLRKQPNFMPKIPSNVQATYFSLIESIYSTSVKRLEETVRSEAAATKIYAQLAHTNPRMLKSKTYRKQQRLPVKCY